MMAFRQEAKAMMGRQDPPQGKLFYTNINLEKRVRESHPLRKIAKAVDFDFIYREVCDLYGHNGNVSVPPPVILKLMLLLVFYNVRSERELMETLPERLDWLWFLGYDLDDEIPNHSVLSKARSRWGVEIFREFFERIVRQCVNAGLVDGRRIFVDSSLVDADASVDSVVDTRSLSDQLKEKYKKLEARLEEGDERTIGPQAKVNNRYVSATDPDAAIVKAGKSRMTYKVHNAVEESNEVITATETTAGDVDEASVMFDLLHDHNETTGVMAETIVADTKYGTTENYLGCHDLGVKAHMSSLSKGAAKRQKKKKLFTEEEFEYDPERDAYRCPAGNYLKRKSWHKNTMSADYAAPRKVCARCELRNQCTKNKTGRTVKRHLKQEELDKMRKASRSKEAKRDIKKRQHLMERSFAKATRYGYKRARWRRLWREKVQNYLICTIQNIMVLVRHARQRASPAVAVVLLKANAMKGRNPPSGLMMYDSGKVFSWSDRAPVPVLT
jgi:transposase